MTFTIETPGLIVHTVYSARITRLLKEFDGKRFMIEHANWGRVQEYNLWIAAEHGSGSHITYVDGEKFCLYTLLNLPPEVSALPRGAELTQAVRAHFDTLRTEEENILRELVDTSRWYDIQAGGYGDFVIETVDGDHVRSVRGSLESVRTMAKANAHRAETTMMVRFQSDRNIVWWTPRRSVMTVGDACQ